MYTISLAWTDFKQDVMSENFPLNYERQGNGYKVFVIDRTIMWFTILVVTADIEDFETNYKSLCNKSMYSNDGKLTMRAESRPLECTTCFCGQADSDSGIGDGKILGWDFSNEDDDITPSGVDYKRKRVEFTFLDSVWIKEGTIYYHNTLKNSYLDLYVVCPSGNYYYTNDGTLTLATEDTVTAHYMLHHPIQGTVAMGDELNTESCSNEIPSYYKFWLEVTVPDTDEVSNGHLEIELYRCRTEIL